MNNSEVSKVAMSMEEIIQYGKPTNVSDFIEAFRTPVEKLGKAIHAEFSGINYRGIKTHDVSVLRIDIDPGISYSNEAIGSRKNQIVVATKLQDSEIESAGQTLKLFIKQLELTPEDIQDGFIRLENVNEDIPKSNCPFSAGIRATSEALRAGKSGFIVSTSGELGLFPLIKDRTAGKEFKSKLEENNSNLLLELRNVSMNRVKHPLVERLIAESAFLIGKAISNRRIQSDIF
jgi:hypothetical protein